MDNFEHKKISETPAKKPLSEKAKQQIATALGIIFLILVIYYGGIQLIDKLSGTRLFELITGLFGKELSVDEKGHTNILLVGVGGEGHEGKDLTDTLIIASINQTDKTTAFLSVPRDLYTETLLGGNRVNRLYEKGKLKWGSEQAIEFLNNTVAQIFALPIHYTVKVDFEAFEKIVDSLEGIDVYVEETINDPLYPKDNTFEYETFYLEKGNQHLDGETALKYARSRKTSSDFDRSRRQQEVLIALKNKAAEENIFTRKNILKDVYYSLTEHVETNLSFREMLSLAEIGAHMNMENLNMATLNDEPIFKGGLLYTPLRDLYGGAYVLLPAGDSFDSVRAFAKLVLYGPPNINKFPLAILNGTKISGLAATARNILNRFGLHISSVANARDQNLPATTWYGRTQESEPLIKMLQELIPGQVSYQFPAEYLADPDLAETQIILEIGADAETVIDKLNIFKNVVELKPSSSGPAPLNGGSSSPAQSVASPAAATN